MCTLRGWSSDHIHGVCILGNNSRLLVETGYTVLQESVVFTRGMQCIVGRA